jgi:hypothetical protein
MRDPFEGVWCQALKCHKSSLNLDLHGGQGTELRASEQMNEYFNRVPVDEKGVSATDPIDDL